MNFSIVLTVKNEEQTLPRLLESLVEFKDRGGEIIVLDTGSTDGTVRVAKEKGCKVTEVGSKFIFEINEELANKINKHFIVKGEQKVVKAGDKLFDYSAARNYASTLAENDFVAMPDADEVYTKFDLDKIEGAINQGADQLEYNFIFSHDQYGKPAIQFRHCKFYNKTKKKWVGIVHEVLSGAGTAIYLDESIIKLEHFQNPSTHRSNYLTGLALDCYQNPDNDRNSHYFARELFWAGRYNSAIKEFKRHIAMNRWPAERGQSMVYTGDCLMALGKEAEALDAYHRAFLIEPSRREALIRLAEHFWRKNDYQKTACYASAALEIAENGFYSNNHNHYAQVPHELLYWAKWYLGDKEGSKEHWKKALECQPRNPKYINDKQFYVNASKDIIIISPTRERPEACEKFVQSWRDTSEGWSRIVLMLDADDPRIEDYKKIKDVLFCVNQKPEKRGAASLFDIGIKKFNCYKYFFGGSDDIIFRTKGWDRLMINRIEEMGGMGIPYANDLLQKERLATLPLIPIELIKKVGYVSPEGIWHLYIDNIWFDIANGLGISSYMENIVVEHMHPCFNKTDWDTGYREVNSNETINHDLVIYKKWQAEELPKIINNLKNLWQ